MSRLLLGGHVAVSRRMSAGPSALVMKSWSTFLPLLLASPIVFALTLSQ
ncbi:MAG: hypothetical protein ABSG43_31440 [Solirubrobacteraceae bacterium]